MELNLEQILQSERAWEYVLLDIVKSEELDPWDIDITKLTENYLSRIKKMKELDLRIPARLILAAAILLRMKSDELVMTEEAEAAFEETFGEETTEPPGASEEIPLLDLRLRRKPLRKITLEDLILTLQKSLEPKEKRDRITSFVLELPEVDITQQIEELYKKILSAQTEKILFTELLSEKTRESAIDTFIPLLHLATENRIVLEQKEFFKELYVMRAKAK